MTTGTTIADLRPLRLVEILDRGFRLYRRNFFKLTAIVAAPMTLTILLTVASLSLFVPLFIFLLGLLISEASGRLTSIGIPVALAGMVASLIMMSIGGIASRSFASSAITQAVADIYLGKPVGIADTYRKLKPHWLSLPCTVFIPILLMPRQYGLTIFVKGAILLIVPSVIVLERLGVRHAARRAWELVRRRFWRMFGFMTILHALNIIILIGPSLLLITGFQFVADLFFGPNYPALSSILTTAITVLAVVILQTCYKAFQWTSVTLMYFDLRVRSEGLDLALQANATETVDPIEVLAQAPPVEKTSLITWREVGYLAIICIGITALYLIPVILAVGVVVLLPLVY